MSRASPSDSSPSLTAFPQQRGRVTTLPAPLTPLIGREDDIDTVCGLLDADDSRILTLIGPGGVGKTRLAIGVATRLESEFAHGAAFVPLAPVRDPALVTAAVAGALELQERGALPLADLITSALRERHLLLVLDNAEHLVEPVALWLSDLLAACPRLTVLTTSRVALHIDGEHRHVVPPLPLPEGANGPLAANAAVALFTQRATAVQPEFALDAATTSVVVDIVRQLEGLPLAIELAAARIAVLSPHALLARLTDRLAVLTGGRRDAPDRHRTMRAAIAWSHDLLSPDEQRLFRRLAVFVGGFTVEAAEAVGGEGVLDRLAALVDHCLVRQVALPGREPRLWMLETIREFGLELLAAHDEETAARDAHAAWSLTLGERTFVGLRGAGRSQWFDQLEVELGNLRAALGWLVAQDRVDDAVDLAMGLFFFFHTRGYRSEVFALFDAFLRHPRVAAPSRTRAKVLLGHGILVEERGDPERALAQMHESVAIFRDLGDSVYTGLALTNIGVAYTTVSEFDRAEEACRAVIAIGRETNDLWLLKAGLQNLGRVLLAHGEVDQAIPLFEKTLAMDRKDGNVYGIELGLQNLAEVYLMREDYDRAEPLLLEALDVLEELGHRANMADAKTLLAKVDRARGDYAAAASQFDDALTLAREVDEQSLIGRVLLARGDLARLQGDVAGAMEWFREAIVLSQRLGSRADVAEGLDGVAGVAVATGDMMQAARLLGAADLLLGQIGAPRPSGSRSAEYEHQVTVARAVLGNAAFAAAREAGRNLTIDAGVVEACAFVPLDGAQQPAATIADTGGLSPRELEVLRLVASGLTNKEIADELFISHRTATSHVSNILTKLDLPTRTAAVAYAIRNGLA